MHGKPVPQSQKASAMATYLEQKHWKANPQELDLTHTISQSRLNKHPARYEIPRITVAHLRAVLQDFKAHKAPGPDAMEVELYKHLPDGALHIIKDHINQWLSTGNIDTTELTARVTSIYKKDI